MVRLPLKKMQQLGVGPDRAQVHAQIFKNSPTISQLRYQLISNGLGAKGSGQFIMQHMVHLVQRQPDLFARAERELADSGIAAEHIRRYFTLGYEAEGLFGMLYEKTYPHAQVIAPFRDRANQFALDAIRKWLGFT